jgi:predicted Ser/Thr protein kinase
MDRPDAGSNAAPGPPAVPPEPPTQIAPPSLEAETVAPTPPPALPGVPGAASVLSLSPGVPPSLIEHTRYRVIKLLGQGGMGSVYLAEHRHMERRVALKVISPDLVTNSEAVRRFHQEVTAAARLGPHPNIVAVHDAEQAGDLHFLVMEFVDGQSLADYLRARGPLPIAEACDYVRQAALGLQHANEQGMVHRDIKPHNLMRTPHGQIKVLDFGLARCGRETDKARTQLTQQGVLMGTADYMAPEQANDSRVADIRADVYSLGCTLYHLLTGRVPFPDGGTVDKIIKHAVEQPAPVGALRRDLPLGVVRIVEKMMAKIPDQRFQTPGEVAEALVSWAVPSARSTGPMTVIPVPALTAVASKPVLRTLAAPQIGSLHARRIRWSANWLMVGGYLNGFVGITMLFVEVRTVPLIGLVAILLAPLILIGSVKMKARQSYRWALLAAYLSLVPTSFCFPLTVFFGLRALSCLSDPQYRAAFPK